jgi:sulfur-oxidizing protein SoxX
MRPLACIALLAAATSVTPAAADALLRYRVAGDAIPERFAPEPGDAARGKEVVVGRDSNCLLCHAVPDSGVRAMGDLGPPLAGVGARLTAGQLRLRLVDSSRLNPDSIMPAYYRVEGLNRVARELRGKPVLTAQQVEDAVAYLLTLR